MSPLGLEREICVTTTSSARRSNQYVKASNTEATDYFSASVALSADGNTLVVGADGEDGAASATSLVPAAWAQAVSSLREQ
jgi:trimeric autotransporter adhesin